MYNGNIRSKQQTTKKKAVIMTVKNIAVGSEILVDGEWFFVTECCLEEVGCEDLLFAIDEDGEEFEFYIQEVEKVA